MGKTGLSQTIHEAALTINRGVLDFQTPTKIGMAIVWSTQLWHVAPACRRSEVKNFLISCPILCRFVADYRVGMAPYGVTMGHIPDWERS